MEGKKRDLQTGNTTGRQRDKHGRFIKGVSGNPNGRPKDDTVKDRLFPLVPKSIERLQQILDNPDSLPRDVIKVAEIVLDRVYGKAYQSVDVGLDKEITVTFADNEIKEYGE